MALPKLLFFAATASAASAAADDQSCLLQAKPSSGDLNDQSGDVGDSGKGTFSNWRFSGVDAITSQRKRVPVDWQIYTHHSGQPAFTKGLLLVDNSGGQQRQALEITAQDCQWRAQKGDQEWTLVKDGESLSVPEGNDYVTGFIVTKNDGLKGHSNVRLNMQMQDFAKDAALLNLACRPQHIEFRMAMQRSGSQGMKPGMSFIEASASFVDPSVSFVEADVDSDDAVAVQKRWDELGGSAKAEAYFQMEEAQKISLLQTSNKWDVNNSDSKQLATSFAATPCSKEDEEEAKKICSKHLGSAKNRNSDEEAVFQDCVFDVCHGAGEEAAVMAKELLSSSKGA